ncbi:uncharacterized protein LOC123689750 [Pieris rapae]|uniref:uncharacterized protein LOC123689750 n=1 Tax=Pieris rapae TaxID=64459 RepID=UPI001E27D69E|nr:uncharacterized protein LOC123689750 [Pieris rapae]
MAPNAGPLRSVQCQRTANVSREKKIIMTICALRSKRTLFPHLLKLQLIGVLRVVVQRIPIDPVIADKWVKNIRLSRGEVYWKPTKNTRICSKHFKNEDKYITQGGSCRLRRNAVPVKDLHISCTGTDDQLDEEDNVDEISPVHGLSGLNAAEDKTEGVRGASNRNLVTESSSQPSTSRGNVRRPSDDEFDYIFDTPRKALLRKKLKKSTLLNLKHRKVIKTLKQKTRRLQKRNKSLKGILSELQKKRFISRRLHCRECCEILNEKN